MTIARRQNIVIAGLNSNRVPECHPGVALGAVNAAIVSIRRRGQIGHLHFGVRGGMFSCECADLPYVFLGSARVPVCLQKMKVRSYDFPLCIVREVYLLKALKHRPRCGN